MEQITITLDKNEVDIIVKSLLEIPAKYSLPILDKFQKEYSKQNPNESVSTIN